MSNYSDRISKPWPPQPADPDWDRAITNLFAGQPAWVCEPRRGYDLTLDVDPPLDEHDPEPIRWATHRTYRSPSANQQDRELGYDERGTWTGFGEAS